MKPRRFGQRGHHVLIQRFARAAWFFGAIENCDRFGRKGKRLDEMRKGEGAIKSDFQQTDLFAALAECCHGLFGGFTAGTHHHQHPLCIRIANELKQRAEEKFFEEFVTNYQTKWESRTFCASGFEIERCSNFVGSGHPSTASAACYEADPKGGIPAECPAPVTQPSPALPGTGTLLQPNGTRLPQRPVIVPATGGANETLPEGVQEVPGE